MPKGGVVKHGFCRGNRSPEYKIWCSMKTRCNNPLGRFFERYGGRGIKVCPQWLRNFPQFLADVGLRPPGRNGKHPKFTLDRINNDGNYEPGNVRWATWSQQTANRHVTEKTRAAAIRNLEKARAVKTAS